MQQRNVVAGALFITFLCLITEVAAVATWQQVNQSGFGDAQNDEVGAVQPFDNYLYAGASNLVDGALIFRSQDALTWIPVIEPGFGIPHDTAPPAILDLAVFGGRLYASTGRGDGPGQIWRTTNGLNWAPVVNDGFHDPDTVDVTALAVYDGLIYAGAANLANGAQIWRSYTGDSNSWSQVAPALEGAGMARVTGMGEFDGALYAAVSSDAPPQIWRSFGGAWTTIVDDGFGDGDTMATGGMAAFAGALYVGAANAVDGAQLWRTGDGSSWEQTIDPGFGDANNEKVEGVFVFQTNLYAVVTNPVTGIEIWRTSDGSMWQQVNDDGFGDAHNVASNGSNGTAHFLGGLYVGTSNTVDGGELWRMTPEELPAYGVVLSPNDAVTGLPGTTVTYTLTLTNTGNVSDTFTLAVSGNAWATALSPSSTTLPAGAATIFTAAVTIPAQATANSLDVAVVTATSQGDSAVSDSVTLATTCLSSGPKYHIYLPQISKQNS